MNKCGWCGKVIAGEPILTIVNSAMIATKGEKEWELMSGYTVDFCCHGCAWAFSAEIHRLMGLSGKELRNHLVEAHCFDHPPGKPAGGMRQDCMVVTTAKSLASLLKKT